MTAPSEAPPRPPRAAATVLVARDGAAGIEVLMMQRPAESSFAAGALVFPGGAVHAEDSLDELRARCRGLPGDAVWAAAAVAGIRETFEECGILLARPAGAGALVAGDAHRRLVETHQESVATHPDRFPAMVAAEALELACDALVPFAHWITPPTRPKRFDTRFLLAAAPPGQVESHDRREAIDAVWARPADIVADADAGRTKLVFATRMNLIRLGRSATVADALAAARTAPIVPVVPNVTEGPEGRVYRIPIEAGYGVDTVPGDNIPRA